MNFRSEYYNGAMEYMECQDFIRFSGIFRDVYLLLREENSLDDIYIRTEKTEYI